MKLEDKHCLVIGIGAGTGAAVARRFAKEGHQISMIARGEERLSAFAGEIPNSTPYRSDISDSEGFRTTLRRICEEQGSPRHVIYNATQATFGTLLDIDTEKYERNFRVNATGLLIAAQELSPAMVEAGRGSIVITGNTAALRGKPNYVGWASTKAAQRNLAESLARELGPSGVHVAYVVIDAVIDMPFARKRWPDFPDDFYAKPADLAAEIYHLANQPRSARSFLIELRPFGEKW